MNFWLLLAGLGFFLLGMRELENGLSGLANQRLRVLLRKHTGTPLRGVALGTVATAILQSSSLLSLLVLAFAGASFLSLAGALAIVFGANIGTTLTGWIITTLGFKMDFAVASYAMIGIGALGLSLSTADKVQFGFRIVAGFGLLVLGLNEMKDAVFELREHIDLAQIATMPVWLFFLVGLLIASVIQSSSATIGITLAALHSGIIELTPAAAMVIGADLGTTSTLILGAIGGAAIKKQIALGQILFNVVVNMVALIFLLPLLVPTLAFFNIGDVLYGLVLFHSVFNILGVLFFLPFLGRYSNWLSMCFIKTNPLFLLHVHQVDPAVPEAALSAAATDTQELLKHLSSYAHSVMPQYLSDNSNDMVLYRQLKLRESGLLMYLRQLYAEKLNSDDARRLELVLQASREAVLAAKALKDIRHNIVEIIEQEQSHPYYRKMNHVLFWLINNINVPSANNNLEWLNELQQELNAVSEGLLTQIYNDNTISDISSTLNVVRSMQEFGARLLNSYRLLLRLKRNNI